MVCPKCNAMLGNNAVECTKCGYIINPDEYNRKMNMPERTENEKRQDKALNYLRQMRDDIRTIKTIAIIIIVCYVIGVILTLISTGY